jgi:hypothetical protein
VFIDTSYTLGLNLASALNLSRFLVGFRALGQSVAQPHSHTATDKLHRSAVDLMSARKCLAGEIHVSGDSKRSSLFATRHVHCFWKRV